jgi:hypothetical protein
MLVSITNNILLIQCDYCNITFEKTKTQYNRSHKSNVSNKDACKEHKYDLIKENNLIKYGVTSTGQLKENIEKRKQTCVEKYGTNNPMQNKEIQDKAKKTNIEKYGVENPSQNKEIKEKRNNSNIKKYGVKSTLLVKEFKDKGKETMNEKYGVEYPAQNKEIQEKMIKGIIKAYSQNGKEIQAKKEQTSLKNFGTSHPMQNKNIIEQRKQTCIEKYGVIAPILNQEVIDKRKETCKQKFNNDYYSGSEEDKINKYNLFSEYLLKRNCILLTTQKEFSLREINKGFDIEVECTICHNKFIQHCSTSYSQNPIFPRCINCYPYNDSYEEKSMYDYICQIYNGIVIRNDISILEGKEIDILLPELNIGFEYNGCFWHSEINGNKKKQYHVNKQILAKEKSIDLFFIYDFEWKSKTEIVKSIINSKIIKQQSYFARKCQIKIVPMEIAKDFYDKNHIQGGQVITRKTINMGLWHNNILVCLISIDKSRYNKKYEYEILRYSNLINYRVVGGFSRLLSYFEKVYNPKSIITYSDCRLFHNNSSVYEKAGFIYKKTTDPNYFYIKNGEYKGSRYMYQKYKLNKLLVNFDSKLSEWENMINNGYDRIWDCGNRVYIKQY